MAARTGVEKTGLTQRPRQILSWFLHTSASNGIVLCLNVLKKEEQHDTNAKAKIGRIGNINARLRPEQ